MTNPRIATSWPAPVATVALWALAAAAAVFWALRISAPADGVAPPPAASPSVAIDANAVARVLGGDKAPSPVASIPESANRFALLGVVTGGPREGAALIAIDGKPARPFRVGARVGEHHVLQSLGLRAVTLGSNVRGEAGIDLVLPVRSSPNLPPVPGVLPVVPGALPALNVPGLPVRSP